MLSTMFVLSILNYIISLPLLITILVICIKMSLKTKLYIIIGFIVIVSGMKLVDYYPKKDLYNFMKSQKFISSTKKGIFNFNDEIKIELYDKAFSDGSILKVNEKSKIVTFLKRAIQNEEETKLYKYDYRNKEIIEEIIIPFKLKMNEVSIEDNILYFSEIITSNRDFDILFPKDLSKENFPYTDGISIFFSYDLNTKEKTPILSYKGQGLPLKKNKKYYYTHEGHIYEYNKKTEIKTKIFKGNYPFDLEENNLYYYDEGYLKSRNIETKKEKIIADIRNQSTKGLLDKPKKIKENIYTLIFEDNLFIVDAMDSYPEYTKLIIMDFKNNSYIDINNYYKSIDFFEYIRQYLINMGYFKNYETFDESKRDSSYYFFEYYHFFLNSNFLFY